MSWIKKFSWLRQRAYAKAQKREVSRGLTRRWMFAVLASAAVTAAQPHMARAFIFAGGIASTATPALNVAYSLNNLDSANGFTAPNFQIGLAFNDGEIPAGGSITAKDSLGNPCVIQQDEEATYPSGCIRIAAVSGQMSETIAASSAKAYTFGASASAPNRTPNAAWTASGTYEQTLLANHDPKVIFTNVDTSATYTVTLNDIFTNFQNLGSWGTANPAGGWQRIAVGPKRMAWRAWKYLKNDASPFHYQGYVKVILYVSASQGPSGPLDIEFVTIMPNVGNAIDATSEQFGVSPTRFAYTAVLMDGVTTIANIGGPNDARAVTITNANINTSTGKVEGAFLNSTSAWVGQSVMISSTGTLPTNVSANTIYWPAWQNGGNSGMMLCTETATASGVQTTTSFPAWSPSTGVLGFDTSKSAVTFNINNNILYYCSQTGATAASGGPSGYTVNQTDNTAKWSPAAVNCGSQGTGTLKMYPVYIAFQQGGVAHMAPNGDPLWTNTGSPRPQIVGGQDVAHLVTTRAVPPYDPTVVLQTPTGVTINPINPMLPLAGFYFNNTTGDGPGDERIGAVNESGVNSILLPSSVYYFRQMVMLACSSHRAYFNLHDERGAQPYIANNGPTNTGTAYPNTPSPQPNFCNPGGGGSFTPAFGTGNWLPHDTTNVSSQPGIGGSGSFTSIQGKAETSHMPRLWYAPYIKTGRRIFLDMGISQGTWMAGLNPYRKTTLNGVTYYSLVQSNINNAQQLRGVGWGVDILLFSRWICPDYEPIRPYLDQACADQAGFFNDWYKVSGGQVLSQQRTFGILNAADHAIPCSVSPWMYYMTYQAILHGAWMGIESGWLTLGNFMKAWWSAFTGTNKYAISAYDIFYGSRDAEGNAANHAYDFQNVQDFIGSTGIANNVITGTVGATATITIVGTVMTISGVSGVITPNATLALADVVTGAGIAANTRISVQTGGTTGGNGTYTVSVSQNVGPVSGVINSAIVNVTASPNRIYNLNKVAGTSVPAGTCIYFLGGTGGTGTYYLGDNSGNYLSQASFFQTGSQSFTLTQNLNDLPAYPGPAQPYLDNFGSNIPTTYPGMCITYLNMARMALKMHITAVPSETGLAAQLADVTATVKLITSILTTGGINYTGLEGGNRTNHATFAFS